jgi:hypothetical protein
MKLAAAPPVPRMKKVTPLETTSIVSPARAVVVNEQLAAAAF